MSPIIDVELGGIRLRLLHQRGVYWPARNALLIADPHFGKEATFRRYAIPVPRGGTEATLQRISAMLRSTGASELIILGDMFHHRSSLTADIRKDLEGFFRTNAKLHCRLVLGNHDVGLGRLPDSWPLEIVEPGVRIDSVTLAHSPDDEVGEAPLTLCGHLHPSIRVEAKADRLRLPCFWWREQKLIFPAIGEFTGSQTIKMGPRDRVWMVTEEMILER